MKGDILVEPMAFLVQVVLRREIMVQLYVQLGYIIPGGMR